MKDKLAILGGEPVVESAPEYRWPQIGDQSVKQIVTMLQNGEISYVGRHGQVRRLEESFREYYGVGHALAVNSGTSALHSAYFALGIGPGDEVLAPTYTFLATVTPILAVNAVPVLVDADEWTGNLDPALLEARITERTKAVAVTHLNGYPVDMAGVTAVARKHGLKVIEDCSHAHGAICGGRKVGTFGDVAAFSVQARKLVTGGEGGVLITDDSRIFERAVLLGHFRDRSYDDVSSPDYRPYVPTGFGFNYRMNPLSACLAADSMQRLEDTVAGRRRNFTHFDALLADVPGVRAPVVETHMDRPVHYSYQPLYVPEELDGLPAEVFVRAAAAEGVPISRPKSPPLHCEPAFQRGDPVLNTYGHFGVRGGEYRVYADGDLPKSEAYVARALRFPAYTDDVRADLDRFAEAMAKVARQASKLWDLVEADDDHLTRIRSIDGRYVETS
ncbi:MAG: DegT/DnrJ/EryC1/StrS family aminotransferase [Stackebrandtia sp.]